MVQTVRVSFLEAASIEAASISEPNGYGLSIASATRILVCPL